MDRLETSELILSLLYPVRTAKMAKLSTVLNNPAILLLLGKYTRTLITSS
jgi:hypothetical protein